MPARPAGAAIAFAAMVMTAADVVEVLELLEGAGIEAWVDGGDQAQPKGPPFHYGPPAGGRIAGRSVRCVAAEAQLRAHLGYAPTAKDQRVVRLLAERLRLEPPASVSPGGATWDARVAAWNSRAASWDGPDAAPTGTGNSATPASSAVASTSRTFTAHPLGPLRRRAVRDCAA